MYSKRNWTHNGTEGETFAPSNQHIAALTVKCQINLTKYIYILKVQKKLCLSNYYHNNNNYSAKYSTSSTCSGQEENKQKKQKKQKRKRKKKNYERIEK